MEKNNDFLTVDRESLVDITQVRLNHRLHGEDRVRDYLEKVGDPHQFRVGDMVVKCAYAEQGPSLNELLQKLILSA